MSLGRQPSVMDFYIFNFHKICSGFQVSGSWRKRKLFLLKHSDVRSEEMYQFQESEYKGIPTGQKELRSVVRARESFEGQESPLWATLHKIKLFWRLLFVAVFWITAYANFKKRIMFVDRCTHIHVCIVLGGRWEHQLLFCYRRHKNSLRNAVCILTVLCTTGPQSPGGPRTATIKTPMSTKTLHTILNNDQPSQLSTYSFLSLSCSRHYIQ